MLQRSPSLILAALTCLALTSCDSARPDPERDASVTDGAAPFDADTPARDGGSRDGGGPSALFPPVVVTLCPGDSLPPATSGRCDVTARSAAVLITGDVLTPSEVLRGGQVLVGTTGRIECAGCDCSGEPAASGATRLVCPDVVVSAALVNAHDHVTYGNAQPYAADGYFTVERYEHRHDWRTGDSGSHREVPSGGGRATRRRCSGSSCASS